MKSKTHRTKTGNQSKQSRSETTKSQKQTKENRRGVYWIMILRDFKRFFYHEKVTWYSIKTLSNLKKVLRYSIKTLCHLKKSLVVFNQDSSSLKKSLVVFKIIQISKDCLINRILMDFVGFSSEISA